VFSEAQENDLVDHLIKMEALFHGLTTKDLRHVAFQLAERNQIDHTFNKEVALAGEDWLEGFRKRHPEISLRAPEPTSAARARAFNQPNVYHFFDLLEGVQDEKHIPPHRIFNVDETGLTTVGSKPSKVLALKGKPQVGRLTSAERGILTTAVITMSASGVFVPPLLIFPRVRMKLELLEGSPPGTAYACHPSGWMQMEIFVQWFRHFLSHTKPSENDPVLLILDGHNAHTRNLEVIELARKNHVILLVLPPHCTHRLQPLDVAFMKPLSTYYTQAIEKYLRNNPGRVVSVFQIIRSLVRPTFVLRFL